MDLSKLNIRNLTEYTSLSRKLATKDSLLKITINISTIDTLNTLKSLEIEYFEKYCESGAAFKVLEKVLQVPHLKFWKDITNKTLALLKYWFRTFQYNIIEHNAARCHFLQRLLYCVKMLGTKYPLTKNKIIEVLGEELLQLTLNEKLNWNQRHESLLCFSVSSATLNRECRMYTRGQFEGYFAKLAHVVPSCGDFRLQFSAIEVLLRWLLPRRELAVRKEVAALWFPPHLYSRTASRIFLDRDWKYFSKDARDFLNAQNENNAAIVSFVCKKLNFGNIELIKVTDKNHWVDFNIDNKCVSVMLEFQLPDILQIGDPFADSLVITEENTRSVELIRSGRFVQTNITLKEPLHQCSQVLRNERELGICMSAINAEKVNEALKGIFRDKFENLLGLERRLSLHTADECSQIDDSEDSRQFNVKSRGRVRNRVAAVTLKSRALMSPSTTSTASLLLLKEKLSAYPGCSAAGEKDYSGVCAEPLLPILAEESEVNVSVPTSRGIPRIGACVFSRNRCRQGALDNAAPAPMMQNNSDPLDTLDGLPEGMAYMSMGETDLRGGVPEHAPLPLQEAQDGDEHYKEDCEFNKDPPEPVDTEGIINLMNQEEFTKNFLAEAGIQTTTRSIDVSENIKTKKGAKPIRPTVPSKTTKKVPKSKGQTRPKRAETTAESKLSINNEQDDNLKNVNGQIAGPMTRRRRKLYSPQDKLTAKDAVPPETEEDQTRSPIASNAPYREIQEMRASHRQSAKRNTVTEKTILSPRSQRFEDNFNRLLETACNGESVMKSDNKRDISIYNFTDSDGDDFEDAANRRNRINVRRPLKKILETKPRKKPIQQKQTLVDERMRNAVAQLDASLVIEKPFEDSENLEPNVSVVRPAIDLDENYSAKKFKGASGRPTKKKTKPKNVTRKGRPAKCVNIKQLSTNVMNHSRDREESISPGLECEIQVDTKSSNNSIADLEENIAKEAFGQISAFETIQTTATIEHVPLKRAPTRGTKATIPRREPADLDSIQTLQEEIERWSPRLSVQRLSEEDIRRWTPPRANSVFGSSPSSEPQLSSPEPRKRNSIIVPFTKLKRENRDHPPKVRREEPEVASSSINVVSSDARKTLEVQTPETIDKRVLATPVPRFPRDRPIKRPAEATSTSRPPTVTRRSREVSLGGSSAEEESGGEDAGFAAPILVGESSAEVDSEESTAVRLNVFEDIFKAVQKRIDQKLATMNEETRTSLEEMHTAAATELREARQHRRALHEETAREILSETNRLLTSKFYELEDRCKRLDERVLENISRASKRRLSQMANRRVELAPLMGEGPPSP